MRKLGARERVDWPSLASLLYFGGEGIENYGPHTEEVFLLGEKFDKSTFSIKMNCGICTFCPFSLEEN